MRGTTILLAEADENTRRSLAQAMTEEGFEVVACRTGEEAVRALKSHDIDALVTELRLPVLTGMELIDRALQLFPEILILVVTAHGQVETIVEAMKKGVRDVIAKPVVLNDLMFRLKRLLAQDRQGRENRWLREQLQRRHELSAIIGVSSAVRAIRDTVTRTAKTMSNVLIHGETGVGKELIARVIHASGVTSDRAFVAVNCVGLVGAIAERELLGHRRGAFAEAESDRVGHLEAAQGGTLFLDEVGGLPQQGQAALLRALEQNVVVRIGESRRRPLQIRVIAATSRDLPRAVEQGAFLEDLLYRLDVVRVNVPPLRERVVDIPLFAQHFLERYNEELKTNCPGFTTDALQALTLNPWRGNVRELQNLIERAVIAHDDRLIDAADLFPESAASNGRSPTAWNLRAATQAFERQHILKTLERFNQSRTKTAKALGIGMSSLYRRLEALGIGRETHGEATTEDD